MNVPAQTVQFEITDLQPTFLDYIQSQKDENTRTFNIQFLFEGDVLSLSGCTATATVTINNIMIEQELACEVNETNNYVTVVVNAPYSGVMAVQVTLTDGTNTLTMPRPLFVRVARDIAETAQIDDNTHGSFAEVVREVADARGNYATLAQAINAKMDVNDATVYHVDTTTQTLTYDNTNPKTIYLNARVSYESVSNRAAVVISTSSKGYQFAITVTGDILMRSGGGTYPTFWTVLYSSSYKKNSINDDNKNSSVFIPTIGAVVSYLVANYIGNGSGTVTENNLATALKNSLYRVDNTTETVAYSADNPRTIYTNARVNGNKPTLVFTLGDDSQLAMHKDGNLYCRTYANGAYGSWIDLKAMSIGESNKTSGAYPTVQAVYNFVTAFVASSISGKEVKSNKKTTLTGNESSNDFYPTTKAVADALLGINAGSVGFDETGTYADGSIGAEVSAQKNAFTFQTSEAIDVSQGYWAITDGTAKDSTTWCRSGFVNFDAVILSNAVKMYLLAYNISGSYVGAWNGTTFSKTYSEYSYLKEISIYDWLKKYPAYRFKIDYKSNSTLTPSDVLSDIVVKKRNNTRIDDINLQIVNNCKDVEFWKPGYWAIADGTILYDTTWARSNQIIDDTVIAVESTTDAYKLFLLAYEGTTYIGTWFGNGFSKTYDRAYISKYIDISDFRNKYPNYIFKLDITKINGGVVDLSDIANTVILKKSKVEQNSKTIQTVYGDIAKSEFWENGAINLQGNKVFDYGLYRVSTCNYLKFLVPVTIVAKDGYVFSVTTYSLNKEKELQFSTWCSTAFTFNRTDKLYKINIKATEASVVLNPENVSNYIESYALRSTPFDRILAEYANVKSIGHRGFNTVAPENTLPAFEMSAAYGFKYVETDILFTQDGVPVLMHDTTINRTCCNAADGSAITENTLVSSLDYDELVDAYDACTPSQWATWKGTKIPTFAEFMYCCKANNLHPWIELKAFGHTYTQAEIQLIISIIKQYGMEEHVSFISFSYDALVLVKNEWDAVELGYNGTVANAQKLKTNKNRVFMLFDQNGSDYSDAIAAGFQVCFYTVNTTEQILALPTNGFDSVLTNVLFPSQVCDTVRAKYDSVK